jgi:hypothetical protein
VTDNRARAEAGLMIKLLLEPYKNSREVLTVPFDAKVENRTDGKYVQAWVCVENYS